MSENPLPAAEIFRYGRVLRGLLLGLDRQVVVAALVCDGERDLLGAVGEEVDSVREFLDYWIGAAAQGPNLGGCGLTVLDSFKCECFSAGHHVPEPTQLG